MSQRYFHPEFKLDTLIELHEQESQHLVKVMRAQVGDEVELINGQGFYAHARIKAIKKKTVELLIEKVVSGASLSKPKLTLAMAPPKGERLDFLVEKITELGIDQLEFLQTSRTIVLPGAQKLQRLEQLAIAACKQSGRLIFPELVPLISFSEWTHNEINKSRLLIIADPLGVGWETLPLHTHEMKSLPEIVVCIGPEGGFTPAEIDQLLQLNAYRVRIAEHILRVETAGIAMASCLAAKFRSS